jgi:uncharacterized membrane protein
MRNNSVREMTIYAMFIAIIIIMSFTPLGYIPVAGVSVTIIPVVVLIMAFLFGLKGGAIGGLAFGLLSFARAWIAPNSAFDLIFRNPLASVLPRILFGIIAGWITAYVNKKLEKSKVTHVATAAVVSAILVFIHTSLVLPMMYFVGPSIPELNAYFTDPANTFWAIFSGIMVANGFLEMAAGAIITPPIYFALKAAKVVRKY